MAASSGGGPGPVIELRPFERSSFEPLIAWVKSPDVLFLWAGGRFTYPLDAPQLERHLAESPPAGRRPFTAFREGTAVGHAELTEIDSGQGSAYIQRLLVDPGVRGGGVGPAVVRAVLREAFDGLGLHRVGGRVYERNPAGRACYARAGLTEEGVLRDAGRFDGRFHNLVIMSVLEHEWRAMAEASG